MPPGGNLRPLAQLISLRSFLPTNIAACSRSFAAIGSVGGLVASSNTGRGGDSDPEEPDVNTAYRSPTDAIWPASKHQERFAARVHNALGTALLNNAGLRDSLVLRLGFGVQDVRMSPDNLKAYIQFDSVTGQGAALEHELERQGAKLRAEVARALRARHAPQLIFRRDALTPRQQEVEDVFRRLEEEEAQGWTVEEEIGLREVAAGMGAKARPPADAAAAAAAGVGPEAAADEPAAAARPPR